MSAHVTFPVQSSQHTKAPMENPSEEGTWPGETRVQEEEGNSNAPAPITVSETVWDEREGDETCASPQCEVHPVHRLETSEHRIRPPVSSDG